MEPAVRLESRRAHRRAVRQLASGVAVLTVSNGPEVHGSTVSAVGAVSQEPLLIGAYLRQNSSFLRRVRDRRWFCVNVLTTEQIPLARWFANPERPQGTAQFDGIGWRPDPSGGAPLLDGCLSYLTCRLTGCLPVGDHFLLLADVAAGQAGEGSPLLSFAGALYEGELIPKGREMR